jgi:hypothetical protein
VNQSAVESLTNVGVLDETEENVVATSYNFFSNPELLF